MRWRIPLLGLVLLLVGGELSAQDVCPVQGAWQLESLTFDGEAQELGAYQQIKLLTASHFAWQGVPEVGDTLGAYADSRYGGGTYRVTETSYTESVDYFVDSEFTGQVLEFSCRVEGDLWYHDREYPTPTGSLQVAEVWRRIE